MTGTPGDTAPPEQGGVRVSADSSGFVEFPFRVESSARPEVHGFRMDVSYNGSTYRGFAPNVGVTTVGGRLQAAVERVLGVPVEITVAGRTDAGVHAAGQVVGMNVPVSVTVEPERLAKSLNAMLGPSIAITELTPAPSDFHARFSARWRSYRYRILNSPVHDPFQTETAWWVADELDLDAMKTASLSLLGEHDFASFCRPPKDRRDEPLVRRLVQVDWSVVSRGAGWDGDPSPDGDVLRFSITAAAFCQQMVRSIVGTLVDVGRGKLKIEDVASILAAKDRAVAGQVAPPHGLCLWAVGYEDLPALAALRRPPVASPFGRVADVAAP